ncbi:MAG: BBE domain-containing protein [Microthrixaceae bacterium]
MGAARASGIGWLHQGSGFGSYSKAFGTGAAGVLQFTVVTADGKVVIANEHQNTELFWALQVVEAPPSGSSPRRRCSRIRSPPPPARSRARSPQPTTRHTRTWSAATSSSTAALNNRSWGEQVRFNDDNTVEVAMTWLDLTEVQATSTWAPLLEPLRAEPGRFEVDVEFTEIPFEQVWDLMWWNENAPDDVVADPRPNQPDNQYWWSGNSGEVSAYWSAYESRWLPLSMYTDQPDDLVRMIVDASRIRGFTIQSNKGLSGADPEALARDRNTALHPSAFDAAALIIMAAAQAPAYPGVEGHEPDMDTATSTRDQVDRAFSIIREALPGQGAYANEASYFTEDWKDEFWGDNYDRLLTIKREVDPDNLFRVHHGVGSDED